MSRNAHESPIRPRRFIKSLVLPLAIAACVCGAYCLYLLYGTGNFRTVTEGQVYRSAQPSAGELKDWISRYGLKTVINLRGQTHLPFYQTERETLEEAGVTMIDIRLTASRLPGTPVLKELIEAIEKAQRPILLHCRDGIDRSGMASVIAAMAIGGETYDDAREHLSWKYFGRGATDDGVAGLFSEYEDYCTRQGVSTGGWEAFRRWAVTTYHPYYYLIDISAPETVRASPGGVVEIPVTITNRSGQTIPASRTDISFRFCAYWGPRTGPWPEDGSQTGTATIFPRRDIAPGSRVHLVHRFPAPKKPGRRLFHLDVYAQDDRGTLFGREGSPVPSCELIVEPPAASRPAPTN